MGMTKKQQSTPAFGDVTNWDESAYRAFLRGNRIASTRTVFAARFGPSPSPDLLAVASSDGGVCLYSISSCISSQPPIYGDLEVQQSVEPFVSLSGHNGAAYDLQFYGEGDDAILLSCGDDGRVQGWHWEHIKDGAYFESEDGMPWKPDFVFTNPQQVCARGALAPMPETNAIATNSQEGHVYTATGDGVACCWDIETQKRILNFKGHSDYLHCICSRPSEKQVVTGSEDGTIRVWDCRDASCVAILDPCKARRTSKSPRDKSPWVSCVAIDNSGKWLVGGSGGRCLTLWSLLSFDAVTRFCTLSAPQAVTIANDQIMTVGAQPHLTCFGYGGELISQVGVAPSSAFSLSVSSSGVSVVGGYGGLVDIISAFGSHICTFQCK